MKRFGIFLMVMQVNGECQMIHMDTEDTYQQAQVNAQDRAITNGGSFIVMPVYQKEAERS